ncbi:MAG: bacteriohemerythrin [Betaproteobacteria bacterium]|nr:bacteriohemerythrin [Betaproteobacteria bacterium]
MKKHELVWNKNQHGVGIALIDEQHRQIIDRVNQIANAVAMEAKSDALKEMLEDMLIFACEHFAVEERLMAEHGYPDMENHIQEHLRMYQQLSNLVKTVLRATGRNKAALVSAYLSDWAERHILQADKELGGFLIAKGLN